MKAFKYLADPWSMAPREPVTIMAAVGAVVAAGAAAAQGIQQREQADFQHDLAMRNADIQKAQADAISDKAKQDAERKLSGIGLAYKKAGIDPTVGSPLDVEADSAGTAALDIANMRYSALLGIDQSNAQAAFAKKAGSDALTGTYIGVGTALLTQGAKAYRPSGGVDKPIATLGPTYPH